MSIPRFERPGILFLPLLLPAITGSAKEGDEKRENQETPPPGAPSDQAPTTEALERRIDALERALQEKEAGQERSAAAAGADDKASGVEVEGFWAREAFDTPAPLRGVYEKPFLVSLWRRAYFGGYTELEYHSFSDPVLGIPGGFRAHRTNLFAYADIADNVRFGSEIEFENEEPGEGLEVKVEMAFIDWVIFEELAVRGGALLVPLGRINVNHDGPVRELTDRPMVSTFVIPTTLTEAGAGFRGTFHLGESLDLSYEAYAVNGFHLLDRNGELAVPVTEREQLLREGRPSLGGDENEQPAGTGRLAVRAAKALELGGSWHVGTYDERRDNILSILAGDLAYVRELGVGALALEGEIAWASFERDTFAETAGVPGDFWGFYAQGSWACMPEALRNAAPHVFAGEGAAFTLVFRYDWIDLDGDKAEAFEPGLNFRPVADTVFKFSYRFGTRGLGIRGVPGRRDFDDDGFIFSFSTYF